MPRVQYKISPDLIVVPVSVDPLNEKDLLRQQLSKCHRFNVYITTGINNWI